jgi:hypothetical protein
MDKDLIELTQSNIDRLPVHIGIYKIYAYQKNADEPMTIRRFVEDDMTGLVYIGMTHKQNLRVRLKNFEISLRKEKTRNHTGAIKLWKREKLNSLRGCRFFAWCSDPIKLELVKIVEDNEIKKYIHDYGESPLLNG